MIPLKSAMFLFKIMRVIAVIGIAVDCIALLLLYNLEMDMIPRLVDLAMCLMSFYIATWGIEHVTDRLKEDKK